MSGQYQCNQVVKWSAISQEQQRAFCMVQMAYDSTNVALYQPEAGDTVFKRGPWPDEVALEITGFAGRG